MSKLVLNSFHEPLLPIGTTLLYKKVKVEIVDYDAWHDGDPDHYIFNQSVSQIITREWYVMMTKIWRKLNETI